MDAILAEIASLVSPRPADPVSAGYQHTLTEISRQPLLWNDTAARLAHRSEELREWLQPVRWLGLTGSGSSEYAGACVHPALQAELGIPAFTQGGGWLLIDGARAVPQERPGLLISLARSGDSPESTAVLDLFLATAPDVRHLIITCNPEGQLATRFANDRRVRVLVLDPRTNDRSLVMTSSFTSMVTAARGLGLLEQPGVHARLTEQLAAAANEILSRYAGKLVALAREPFEKVVYLGTGCRFGAAREAALKMLEMNAGRIPTMAETYLGLRHGPMCLVDERTLVVCFLSSGALARAYELDLISELNRKELGARKLIVGEAIPTSLLEEGDVALDIPALDAIGDDSAPVLDVLTGQLLAFFRCLRGGLQPDQPSAGVINRVVNGFKIHTPELAPRS